MKESILFVRNVEEKKEIEALVQELDLVDLASVVLSEESEAAFCSQVDALADSKVKHFVVCGGDGSLNRLVNAMMKNPLSKTLSFGVVPLGTANDFARSMGFPEDRKECVRLALQCESSPVDVIRLEDRYFINVCSAGNLAKVTREVSSESKKQWGVLAYLFNGLKELVQIEEYRCFVEINGQAFETSLSGFTVGNGAQAGGGFKVAENYEVDDSYFEVLLISSEITAAQMAELFIEAKSETPDFSADYLKTFKTKKLTIKSQSSVPLNLDGEAWDLKDMTFEIMPRSLSFARPQSAGASAT